MKLRWDLIALAYSGLGIVGGLLASIFNGTHPLRHPHPLVELAPWLRESLSSGLGLAFALFVVATTRILVIKTPWARRLHHELRPVTIGMGTPSIVLVAVLSSFGEEMFFRAFLTPLVGVVAQAALFGLAHQVRGPSRWIWMVWAGGVGLVLGGLFWLTGSLAGALVAHAVINAVNLMYLRDHDPASA